MRNRLHGKALESWYAGSHFPPTSLVVATIHEPVEVVSIIVWLIWWDVVIGVWVRRIGEIGRPHQRVYDASGNLRHRWRSGRRRSHCCRRCLRDGLLLGLLLLSLSRLVRKLHGRSVQHGLHLLLLLLLTDVFVGPTPFLFELRFQKVDSPARLLTDLFKYCEDFRLFLKISKALCCYRNAADCGTGNASTSLSAGGQLVEKGKKFYLSLTCATMPQVCRAWCICISYISGTSMLMVGWICESKHIAV